MKLQAPSPEALPILPTIEDLNLPLQRPAGTIEATSIPDGAETTHESIILRVPASVAAAKEADTKSEYESVVLVRPKPAPETVEIADTTDELAVSVPAIEVTDIVAPFNPKRSKTARKQAKRDAVAQTRKAANATKQVAVAAPSELITEPEITEPVEPVLEQAVVSRRQQLKDKLNTAREQYSPFQLALKKHVEFTTKKYNELDDTLYEKRKWVGGATAAIALVGVGVKLYMAAKGYGGSSSTGVISAVAEQGTGGGVTEAAPAVEANTEPSTPEITPETLGETVTVEKGAGFGDLINERAQAQGLQLTGTEIYDIYKEMDDKLDGKIITGGTYTMSNGDSGISSPGPAQWYEMAQRMLDETIEAEKKKKGIS